jgi:hypothetical protein
MTATPEETTTVDHSALRANLVEAIDTLDSGAYDTISILKAEFKDDDTWLITPTKVQTGGPADNSIFHQNFGEMISMLDAGDFDSEGIRHVEFVNDGSWLIYPKPLS